MNIEETAPTTSRAVPTSFIAVRDCTAIGDRRWLTPHELLSDGLEAITTGSRACP
jgi:hypothetical protein